MARIRWLLLRFRSVPAVRRALAVKAAILLLGAKTALRVIPVRHILRFLERRAAALGRVGRSTDPEAAAKEIEEVRWAVLSVSRSSPVRFVCFPQCIAGSLLLHGRGISSVLHYGVARKDGKLVTHTWLQAGDIDVIGGEVSREFTLISSF